MKEAIIAALIVLTIYLLSVLIKIDPTRALVTMIAYWIFLNRLEKEEEK